MLTLLNKLLKIGTTTRGPTATPWMQYHNHTCTKAPRDIAWYFRGLRAGHKLGDQPALHDVTTVRMLAKLFYPPGPLTSESASKVKSSTAVSVAFCLVIGRVVLASESCQERTVTLFHVR